MWRAALQKDVPEVQRFLRLHLQSSMFPLGNLEDFGLGGSHPRGMSFWLLGKPLRGVLGITNEGMVFPQCPNVKRAELFAVWDLIQNRAVSGIIGETAQVRDFVKIAGWRDRLTGLNDDEPAFSLNLNNLVVPQMEDVRLVPLAGVDRNQVIAWRRQYLQETPGLLHKELDKQAREDLKRYLERDSHRALIYKGQPVAMTGFNSALSDVVQVGGVFTPRELRGRSYARTAVALHLKEAREAGVNRAVLFAASNAAARAYIAIGFMPAGSVSLVLFNDQTESAQ